jgi:hypothetical protein
MCSRTVTTGAVSDRTPERRERGDDVYIFKSKELVAAVAARGPDVGEQLLERRGLGGVWILLRGRRARCWAGRTLSVCQYQPL